MFLQINVLVLIITVYLPIGVVFLNHFMNILSVHRIFIMFWQSRVDDSIPESDDGDRIVTVQLFGTESNSRASEHTFNRCDSGKNQTTDVEKWQIERRLREAARSTNYEEMNDIDLLS